MAKVPDTYRLPLDRTALREAGDDPEALLDYVKKLILSLQSMYAELADAINQNRDDYEAHTTHPP